MPNILFVYIYIYKSLKIGDSDWEWWFIAVYKKFGHPTILIGKEQLWKCMNKKHVIEILLLLENGCISQDFINDF